MLEDRCVLAAFLPGDANQDYHFDESDFVHVFKLGKYETREPATWQEGDWNATGDGNPPAGDGVFDSGDFVSAFTVGAYKLGPYSDEASEPVDELQPLVADAAPNELFYDVLTGFVTLRTAQPWTTIHLRSASGILRDSVDVSPLFRPPFDVIEAHNLFLMWTQGQGDGDVVFDQLLQPGLPFEFLLGDLSIDGSSLLPIAGDIGDVQLTCDLRYVDGER